VLNIQQLPTKVLLDFDSISLLYASVDNKVISYTHLYSEPPLGIFQPVTLRQSVTQVGLKQKLKVRNVAVQKAVQSQWHGIRNKTTINEIMMSRAYIQNGTIGGTFCALFKGLHFIS